MVRGRRDARRLCAQQLLLPVLGHGCSLGRLARWAGLLSAAETHAAAESTTILSWPVVGAKAPRVLLTEVHGATAAAVPEGRVVRVLAWVLVVQTPVLRVHMRAAGAVVPLPRRWTAEDTVGTTAKAIGRHRQRRVEGGGMPAPTPTAVPARTAAEATAAEPQLRDRTRAAPVVVLGL